MKKGYCTSEDYSKALVKHALYTFLIQVALPVLFKRVYLSDVQQAFGFGSPTLGDAALGAEPLGTESLRPELPCK